MDQNFTMGSGETPASCHLRHLVEQHYALLYRFAYRLSGSAADAEDLTQQTFLIAQRKLEQLRDPNHAKAWLCTILRNVFRKGLRDESPPGRVVSLELLAETAEEMPIHSTWDSEDLQSLLNELPEEFRTPLILYYFDEFSYKEIAEQMGVPLGTVMSRLARGKTHLRRLLLQHPVELD